MEVAQRPFCDWVQMMENSQLKLLFEISLFIRANNPFAMPISLNMDNIKKSSTAELWNPLKMKCML